jgi:hypothetical protein
MLGPEFAGVDQGLRETIFTTPLWRFSGVKNSQSAWKNGHADSAVQIAAWSG